MGLGFSFLLAADRDSRLCQFRKGLGQAAVNKIGYPQILANMVQSWRLFNIVTPEGYLIL